MLTGCKKAVISHIYIVLTSAPNMGGVESNPKGGPERGRS